MYVAGEVYSLDYPITSDAFCSTFNWGKPNAVLSIMDTDLTTLFYSTFIGGSGFDYGNDIALGPEEERLYVWGDSDSSDINVTIGAIDPTNDGDRDTILWEMDLTSMNFTYTTFIGSGWEETTSNIQGIAIDGQGMLYLAGSTISTDFFTTEDAFRRVYKGSADSFVIKLDPTPCPPPSPPGNLTVTPDEAGALLNWTSPPFEGALLLELRLYKYNSSVAGNWSLVQTLDPSSVSWFDANASVGVTHSYRISAVNSAGEGDPSGVASGVYVLLPSAPLDMDITPDMENWTVDIAWSPPDFIGGGIVSGYCIYRGGTIADLAFLVETGNETFYVDRDVEKGDVWYYAVSALNERGEGPRSEPALARLQYPPSAPLSFSAEPGDGRAYLTWEAPLDNGGSRLLGYRIFKGTSHQDMSLLDTVHSGTTSYLDLDLVNSVVYYYYLVAYTELAPGTPTEVITAIAFSLPGIPEALTAVGTDRQVDLSWEPPSSDGGRPIEGYVIYFGESSSGLTLLDEVGDVTTYTHIGLTNGETYYYEVAAVNEAGTGRRSNVESAVPMGPPSAPVGLKVVLEANAPRLTWSSPTDWGGATSLTYHVLRGTSSGSLEGIGEMTDMYMFKDTACEGGVEYHYAVQAANPTGMGPMTPVRTILVPAVPGPVLDLAVVPGDGSVELTWSPPEDDGGSEVTEYVLMRGLAETSLDDQFYVGNVLRHTDGNLDNGRTYYYAVYPVNGVGDGERSTVLSATPWARPNFPPSLEAEARGEVVILTWKAPVSAGNAPVTGYVVLRGTTRYDLRPVADLGLVQTYTDTDVEEGKAYFYQVMAKSAMGPSEPAPAVKVVPGKGDASGGKALWPLALVVALVVFGAVLGLALLGRARARRAGIEGVAVASEEAAGGAAVPAGAGEATTYVVEEVFLVHGDGRLITSVALEGSEGQDSELMSGMLIAVQGIIQDGLQLGGTLEGIKYGENNILMATGEHVNLAVVLYGEPDDELKERLRGTVRSIETQYAGVIEEWSGDPEELAGIDDAVRPLLEATGGLTREDVEAVTVPRTVTTLSAVDFHRGYVRLKAAVVNNTSETIVNASIQLRYDPDMLRLEWVEPGTLRLKGDRVTVGNVMPRERKTVAFMFDPQICQGTHIDGTLTYYDSKGEVQRLDMKRRRADVVCPTFSPGGSANTAMLRRLVREKLHQSDHRVFHYPKTLSAEEVLWIGKQALETGDLQEVREYVRAGLPYEAEVWYYGETKVKGYQMVMRLGVVQESRALELFVASTALEPVTGLMAEFKRELERIVKED